jgi:hypothetical protein
VCKSVWSLDVPGGIDVLVMMPAAVLADPCPILQSQSRIFHITPGAQLAEGWPTLIELATLFGASSAGLAAFISMK